MPTARNHDARSSFVRGHTGYVLIEPEAQYLPASQTSYVHLIPKLR